jgi:SAM-dependent methyltransferase
VDNIIHLIAEAPRGLDFSRNEYPYPDDSERIWYERPNGSHLKVLFSYFEDKNRRVLDIGCGKGYAVYKINKMGFACADGVEYDAGIADIARSNMEKLGLVDNVCIYNMDAAEFDGYDGYDVIYMFHPFKAPIMEKVAARVEESLLKHPRTFTVVYFHPIEHLVWDRTPMFYRSLQWTLAFANVELDVYYYEFDPNFRSKSKKPEFKKFLENAMK